MNRLFLILIAAIIVSGAGAYIVLTQNQAPPENGPQQTLIDWVADGTIIDTETTKEYNHTRDLGQIEVFWRNDDEHLFMALKGDTTGWISIGLEPTTRMQDADMIFGWVEDDVATVQDLFSTGPTGPHPPDTTLGGTNDIIEFEGTEIDGVTIIEFKRKLDTGDQYDHSLAEGQTIDFIWAMATVDNFTTQHNIATGNNAFTLD
jgi:hypothetical protein